MEFICTLSTGYTKRMVAFRIAAGDPIISALGNTPLESQNVWDKPYDE